VPKRARSGWGHACWRYGNGKCSCRRWAHQLWRELAERLRRSSKQLRDVGRQLYVSYKLLPVRQSRSNMQVQHHSRCINSSAWWARVAGCYKDTNTFWATRNTYSATVTGCPVSSSLVVTRVASTQSPAPRISPPWLERARNSVLLCLKQLWVDVTTCWLRGLGAARWIQLRINVRSSTKPSPKQH
jgi:hypothetical protein